MPSGLLAFHRLAAARGDGLDPRLRGLLERRAAIEANPRVVEIGVRRGDAFIRAGPCAAPGTSEFLPAKVAGLVPASPVPAARKGKTACTSP